MKFSALLPLLAASLLLSATGCRSLPKLKPHGKTAVKPAPAPQPLLIGTITLVNEESRFVLIDNGDLPAPGAGSIMKSYTGGDPSGELLSTAMKRRPYIIADIKEGAPKKGDRVMLPPADQPSVTPRKTLDGTPVARATSAEPPAETAPAPAKKRWWKLF